MWNAGLDEYKLESRFAGEITITSITIRCADNIILMAERKKELKSLLTMVKEESEKVYLKFNI